MRKLLVLLCVVLVSTSAMAQQTAAQVIARYNEVTGLNKADFKAGNMMMDVAVATPQGNVAMQIIKAEGAKYRITANMAGQEMLAVANGEKGWMKVPGQAVQTLPKEAIDQLASQGDMTGSLKLDETLFDFVLTGEENGNYVVLGTPKKGANTMGITELVAYFSTKTDMMTRSISKLDIKGNKVNVDVKFSAVKDFNGLNLPSIMEIATTGAPMMTLTIKELNTIYPTAAWMFTEPK
ncbi:MAG: hypothetical protein RSF93_04615 [Mucinivorans sp.]